MHQGRATLYSWMYGCSNAPKVWRSVINRYSDCLTCSRRSQLCSKLLVLSNSFSTFCKVEGIRYEHLDKDMKKDERLKFVAFHAPLWLQYTSQFRILLGRKKSVCLYISPLDAGAEPNSPWIYATAVWWKTSMKKKNQGPLKGYTKETKKIMMWSIFWL